MQAIAVEDTPPSKRLITDSYQDSVPQFPTPVTAPKGAPNIFLILTDDVGFGAASTFGGPIPTPNLDRLAERGLIFNRFHTTAMCSPTRASLLTGRNHHAVGNGIVANLSTGFPGYNNLMPKSAGTIAQVLKENGYNTAMFGKHHNAPEAHVSPAGPFDLWPSGLGFDYFFGFMGAETNQFTPALYRDNQAVPTLAEGLLDKALADDAIRWIHNQKAVDPEKPFFLYYAPGSAHAPLQAPKEWLLKFRGKFDQGYDVVRHETHHRQLAKGLIPAGTQNTVRPDGIIAWQDLTTDQRKISARVMEAYAAMLAYQDDQIGRIFSEMERMGINDNSMILFIQGDNGAAAEGGSLGSTNPMASFANGMKEDEAALLTLLDEIGGPNSNGNYGFGWAWATNSPFPMVKQLASHLGGTRNAMVVSWPKTVKSGGIRSQFTHVIDVKPTILESIGIKTPEILNGIAQQPIDGISFAYSFHDSKAAERRHTQYFEMMGNQAIYHRGWLASTTPMTEAWAVSKNVKLPNEYDWELYDLTQDFSQSNNLAARHPEKLAEMKRLFRQEANNNQVYPLDNRMTMDRFLAAQSLIPQRQHFEYWGANISIPALRAAPLLNRSFHITANVKLPVVPAQGVLLALGSKFGGWSFYMDEGRPTAYMAATHLSGDQFAVTSDHPIPANTKEISFDFQYDGGINKGGIMVIKADGHIIGQGRIQRTISKLPEMTDTMDIGFDADTPVTHAYAKGGHFNGDIMKVDVTVAPLGLPHNP